MDSRFVYHFELLGETLRFVFLAALIAGLEVFVKAADPLDLSTWLVAAGSAAALAGAHALLTILTRPSGLRA